MKVLIFDLDGTLLDTLDDLRASTNFALAEFGFPARSRAEIRRFVGNGVRNLVMRAIPDGESNPRFEEVFAAFRAHYAQHCEDQTRPYDGILSLLERMVSDGFRCAIVSNKSDEAVQALKEKYFSARCALACGEREGIRKKPAPDSTNEVMKRLGAMPEECIFIGDSEVDYQTAKNAGIPCVLVTWGFRHRTELEAAGQKIFASDANELEEILRSHFA